MDGERFDVLLRWLTGNASRRIVTRALAGVALVAPSSTLFRNSDTEAKKKKHKKKKKKCKSCSACQTCRKGKCQSKPEGEACGGGKTCRSGACVCPGDRQDCGDSCATCCGADDCRADQACTGGECMALTPGNLIDGDATFVRCGTVQSRPYDLYVVDHPGGAFQAAMRGVDTAGGTLEDPFLFLYVADLFDPTEAGGSCTGLVDDANGVAGCPTNDAELFLPEVTAGRYFLLASVSGTNPTDRGTYTLEFVPYLC